MSRAPFLAGWRQSPSRPRSITSQNAGSGTPCVRLGGGRWRRVGGRARPAVRPPKSRAAASGRRRADDSRAAAGQQGPEPKQFLELLEHVVLVGTSEARALEDAQRHPVPKTSERRSFVLSEKLPNPRFRSLPTTTSRVDVCTGDEQHAHDTRPRQSGRSHEASVRAVVQEEPYEVDAVRSMNSC